MSEPVLAIIRRYLDDILPEMGLELFDLQFHREGHGQVLRVTVDVPQSGDTGVTLEKCSAVSRALGQYLDVEDCIPESYYLEVSSPGLDRPLRSPAEFERYIGKMCKVRTHYPVDGDKVFVGEIKAVEDGEITLELEAGQSLRIEHENINKARLWF
ncbi:ribosome maturation factor RimP [Desulforhopalus vacuolatus]|uniref:ribosome maturation factor RimP n=1 Tax=Desulforhopalus vacuolatus TaxID=40414 RepID=UPI0019626673|nr:ribosome maturation factor RimP [Desulforhopalus vacuolatus]MBM9518704.1 ribosome maturation factor RimP [Desulforhopalus vacuolatus]